MSGGCNGPQTGSGEVEDTFQKYGVAAAQVQHHSVLGLRERIAPSTQTQDIEALLKAVNRVVATVSIPGPNRVVASAAPDRIAPFAAVQGIVAGTSDKLIVPNRVLKFIPVSVEETLAPEALIMSLPAWVQPSSKPAKRSTVEPKMSELAVPAKLPPALTELIVTDAASMPTASF